MTLSEIASTKTLFKYYKSLGEKCMAQLKEEDLFKQQHPSTNSIAIIVNHLRGNMMSRWTNFLTEDGEKTWRKRDQEFEPALNTRQEVLAAWEEGWTCLFEALDSLNENNLEQTVFIRNQAHSILDSLQRQIAHYAYHIGQIVFMGKMFTQEAWQSLSIPKGDSEKYNQNKFSAEKNSTHFTQEFLKKK